MGNQAHTEKIQLNAEGTATGVLKIITELLAEMHAQQLITQTGNLDSTLDREVGVESLARVELLSRIEHEFHIAFPERIFIEAETPRDLLRATLSASSPKVIENITPLSQTTLAKEETAPISAKTLIDVLDWHVLRHPDRPHIKLYNGDEEEDVITYRDLMQGAETVMAGLQQHGVVPGEAVAIMLPPDRDYFYTRSKKGIVQKVV